MENIARKEKRIINLFIQLCGLLTVILGVSAILGWILVIPEFASFASGKIPMALSSAVLFVAFGFVIFFYHPIISNSIMFRVGVVISYSGILIALLLLSLVLIGIHPDSGHIGFEMSSSVDGLIVGQMSPVSSFCFVLISLSFLIILKKPGQKKLIKTSLIFAVLVFFISIIFLLSYLLGTPLLYEGSFIPPALTTSLAFLFLGIALLLISGLKVWSYEELSNALSTRYTYILVLVFVILIIGVMTAGYSYYINYEKQFRLGIEQDLSSIATLKVHQIVQWRKERLGDAKAIYMNAEFSGLIYRLLKNQNDIDVKKRIQIWIDIITSSYLYESISLHDLKGRELVTSPMGKIHSHVFFPKLLSEIQKSGDIIFKDFYRDENDLSIYLGIFIPIQSDNNLIGILDLRLDPRQYLYPLINEWPTPSKTAETLIVRREGNETVFLNELKFQKNTALNLRRPLTELKLPAARAALGKKEFIDGTDYRGVPVIAYVCPIPDSPWFLVTRIDKSEVYAPLRKWLWAIIILVVVLIIGSGASVGFVWRNQRSKFHLERYQSTENIRKLNRVYAVLSDINGAIVRIRNPQELFKRACDIAVEKGGFQMAWVGKINTLTKKVDVVASNGISEEYLKKIDFNYSDDESLLGVAGRAIKNGVHVISNDIENDNKIQSRHKSTVMYGCNSLAAFPLKVFGQVWGVFKIYSSEIGFFDEEELKLLDELVMDLSFAIEFAEKEAESKQAGDKLIASEVRYRRLFESAKDGILILDAETGKIVDVNPFLIDLLGYSKENFIEKEIWEIGFFKDIVANYDKFLELQQKKYVRYENLPLETSNGRKINVEFVSNVYLVNNKKVIQCNIRDITERRRAEEALIKSETEFHTLAESMPQIVWITRADGWNIYFNQKWMVYTGLTLEESYGHGWNKPFHPDDQQMAWDAWQDATKNNAVYSIESRLRRADGVYNWFLVRGVPLLDNKGTILKWFGTCTDINELKLAEDELRESEERFRITAENLTDVIYDWDIKENIHWYGDIDGITGYQPGGFPRTNEGWSATIHPEDKDRVTAALEDHLKHAATYAIEYRVRRRDGEWRWWSARGTALRNAQGEPYKMMGSIKDITEQKEIQNRIKFNSELLSHIGQSVIATDLQGNVIYWNHGAEEIYGWSSVEAMGQNIVVLTPTEQTKEQAIEIMKLLSEGNSWFGEFLVKRKDGSIFPAEVTDAPIIDSDGKLIGIIGISSDITERKLTEESLMTLSSAVEQTADTIIITNPEGIIEYVNPSFEELTGYSSEEALGKTPRIIKSDKRDQKYYEGMWNTILSGNVFRAEVINKKKNGDLYYEEKTISPIFDKNKNITHFVGTGVDITERKEAEQKVRESEKRFKAIFDQAPLAIALLDLQGHPIISNLPLSKMVGYSSDELAKMKFTDFTYPEDVNKDWTKFVELIEGKISQYSMEKRYVHKNGNLVWVNLSVTMLRNENGNSHKIIGMAEDITERKRAEELLHESEDKYRSFFENSMDAIFLTSPQGEIFSANPAACKMFGYSEEEFTKLDRAGVIDTTDPRLPVLLSERALKGKAQGEITLIRKGGTHFLADLSSAIFKNHEGLERTSMIIRDITGRKYAEETLRVSEEKFRIITENSADAIFVTDNKGRYLYVNSKTVNLLGYTKEELLTLTIADLAPKDKVKEYFQIFSELLKDGKSYNEIELLKKDGNLISVDLNAVLLPNGLIYGSCRDITDRKHTEEVLLQSETKFRKLINSLPDPVLVVDTHGRIIYCNDSAIKVFDYNIDEMLSYNIEDLIPKDFRKHHIALMSRYMSEPKSRPMGEGRELFARRKDGSEFPTEIMLEPVEINKNQFILAIVRDITDRKRAEKELIEAKERAEESDKLKTEFLAQMSHEIRTPINIMLGNVDYLQGLFDEKIMDADTRDCFEGIDLASKRIIRTVDLVLNASELQISGYKPQLVRIDLDSEILSKLFKEHEQSAKQKGLEIEYICNEKDTNVIADEYSITQIFVNLIDNAIKYTKKGKVEILLKKNNTGNIMVEIKDTGIGMSTEFLAKMFEPFVQEEQGYSRSYDGNGLGLALVKNYCDINNAVIEVESKKSVGSIFRVIFNS